MKRKFIESISALDNIATWAERDSLIKETVSQHTFKVSAIANWILTNCCELDEQAAGISFICFKLEVLEHAITHDFDESIIGRDLSHKVKYNEYNGENIRSALNQFVEHEYKKCFGEKMKTYNQDVNLFVKLCDWIAMWIFVNRNRKSGCVSFAEDEKYIREKILECYDECSRFLKEKQGIILTLNFNFLYD